MTNLKQAFGLTEDESPFPWQENVLAKFMAGIGNLTSLDIPTGLGKTSVMAAWLVARSQGASLPRRLVYVVDRRAVVDQATRTGNSNENMAAAYGLRMGQRMSGFCSPEAIFNGAELHGGRKIQLWLLESRIRLKYGILTNRNQPIQSQLSLATGQLDMQKAAFPESFGHEEECSFGGGAEL